MPRPSSTPHRHRPPARGSSYTPAPASAQELWARARALAGHTLGELAMALGLPLPDDPVRGKGFVGKLVELALGADPTAGERPDFVHLGVELKTVPVGPSGRPLQSTFVCSIDLLGAAGAQWCGSRLQTRLGTVLMMPYAPGATFALHRFLPPVWWVPDAEMWAAIAADWEDLMGAIGAGRGATLTAREGRLLQVRPKAAHARVRTQGPAEDGMQAMLPLGFYLRASCVARVLGAAEHARGPHKPA